MRELLPKKNRGDRLSADHVNTLSSTCRKVAAGTPTSYTSGIQYSVLATSPIAPFQQELVKIVDEVDGEDGVYNIRRRYYDHTTELWQEDSTGNQFQLDANSVGTTYNEDDIVVAFWHVQRRAFVPAVAPPQTILKIGKAFGTLDAGTTTGQVKIWENGAETDTIIEDVHHDWITNDLDIEDGNEVIIGWFPDDTCWRVIGAECP